MSKEIKIVKFKEKSDCKYSKLQLLRIRKLFFLFSLKSFVFKKKILHRFSFFLNVEERL